MLQKLIKHELWWYKSSIHISGWGTFFITAVLVIFKNCNQLRCSSTGELSNCITSITWNTLKNKREWTADKDSNLGVQRNMLNEKINSKKCLSHNSIFWRRRRLKSILFLFIFIGYRCLTMLCSFLLYRRVNQLHI